MGERESAAIPSWNHVEAIDETVRDLTRRKRSGESLRVSEERLRLALEATREVVWDWDVAADRFYLGARWAQMLGYPPEQTPVCMKELRALIHFDDAAAVAREVAAAVRGKVDTLAFECRVRAASGEWRWMFARARVVERSEPGRSVRIVGTYADVTARKLEEEAVHEVETRRERSLAVLAHELRNPLAAARNAVFVLDHASGEAQARAALAIADRQLAQLTQLVEDLLDLSRINTGKMQIHATRLDLVDLARRSVEGNRYAFVARGIELRLEVPRDPVWVDCDATRLVQVLGNLLQNAAKFTARGHVRLAVEVEPAGETACVRVRDTGVGIEPRLRPRLFRAFEQADSTLDRSKGGLGLGLALVKGLVEMHGGTVEALSDGPGTGAEFVVRLPLRAPPIPVEVPRRWTQPARPLRILAVEDEEDAAVALGEMLALLGHHADVARSGPAAVAMARRLRPDIVLCDIGLPGMSGYEVARAIRADPDTRLTTLVALTGYASPADVQRAADAGFEKHLAKPIPPAELSRFLATVSRRCGPASPP